MRTINTALLSFGMSGRVFHAPFIHLHRGFTLAGAWERSRKQIREHYATVKSYASLEEVLADPEIELVVVNTPTDTHYEYARKSLLAGKNVVVEKAFTTTAAEANELKHLADRLDHKLSVFQNRRWDSDFKTVRKILGEKLLGEIVEATLSYDRYNPTLSHKLHKETAGAGSGIVKDLGPHCIDQALVLFGLPQAVFADIRTTRPQSKVDDYFEIILYYPQLRVRLKSGYYVREPGPAYVIHGTKGSFLKNRSDVQEAQLQAGMKPDKEDFGIEPDSEQGFLHTEKEGVVIKERVKSLPGNYMEYYDGLYHAVVDKRPLPVTADEGIDVMRIIDASVTSNREKKVMDL